MKFLNEISARRYLVAVALTPAMLLTACGGSDGQNEGPKLDKPVLTTSSEAGSVVLTWPPIPNARYYEVQRCDAPCGAAADALRNCTPVSTVTASSSRAVDLPRTGNAVCYRAQACSDASKSNCSGYGTPASGAVLTVVGVTDEDRRIWSGQRVTLSAFATNASGTPTFQWVQESGPKVTLDNPAAQAVSFIAPALTGATNDAVSFKINVTDAKGPGQAAKVAVTIHPAEKLVVTAGVGSRDVIAGDRVSLHASATGAVTPAFTWTQVSPASPSIALQNGNTANPSFTAPSGSNSTFLFRVDYRDTTTGGSASDTVAVAVRQPASQPNGQPLTVPAVTTAIPPPPLVLTAPADSFAVAGTTTRLTMAVAGGTRSYSWSWTQTGGVPATLNGQGQSVLTVNVPNVTAPEVMTFRAQVTDTGGSTLAGTARVQILPAPQPNVPPQPVQQIVVKPRPTVYANAGAAFSVRTLLSGPTVVQTAGSVSQVATASASGTTTITITPPVIVTSSETLQFTVTGTNANNETVREIISVVVNRSPGQAPPAVAPPVVQAPVPTLLQPLAIVSCGTERANEGQTAVVLGACPTGGTGNYTYSWAYSRQPGGPAITLNNATTSHPNVNLPGVPRVTPLRFEVTVRDGQLVATAPIFLVVNDIAATLALGALADLTVDSSSPVTLNVPSASGGVPPYTWSIRQTAGTSVGNLVGSNPSFTAPTLAAGGADQTFTFEYSLTDQAGNMALVTQKLIVRAPPVAQIPPLTVAMSIPSCVVQETPSTFNATASGGVPPYSFAWDSFVVTNRDFSPTNAASTTFNMRNTNQGQFESTVNVTVTDSRGTRAVANDKFTIVEPGRSCPVASARIVPGSQAALDACAKFGLDCNSCTDTFLGDCAVDFDGLCDDDFVAAQCQRTCGYCTAEAAAKSAILGTTKAVRSRQLNLFVTPR